jgi:hypothetical protein
MPGNAFEMFVARDAKVRFHMAIGRNPQRILSFEHRPDAARGGVVLAAVAIAVIVLFLWLRSGTEAETSVTPQVASSSSTTQNR